MKDLRGVVFFDVDGTLVPGTSSSAYLAGHLGQHSRVAEAELAYAEGSLTNQEVSAVDAAGWAGQPVERIAEWLGALPLVSGVAETVAWCRGHRLLPVLATLAWEPVGRYLVERFGFAAFCGPSLEIVDGQFTGVVERDFDEYGKRDFALEQARRAGVGLDRCGAVGDSRSDLPLFAAVGLSVAFNASAAARNAATTAVDGDDLRLTWPALERLLTVADC